MAYWQTFSFWILFGSTVVGAISIFFDMRKEGTRKPTLIGWSVVVLFGALLVLGAFAIRSGIQEEELKESKGEARHFSDSLKLVDIGDQLTRTESRLTVIDSAMKEQGYKYRDGKIIPPIVINKSKSTLGDHSPIIDELNVNKERELRDQEWDYIKRRVNEISKETNLKEISILRGATFNGQKFTEQLVKALRAEGFIVKEGGLVIGAFNNWEIGDIGNASTEIRILIGYFDPSEH